MFSRRYAILIVLAVLLAGCGGGGSQPTIPVGSGGSTTSSGGNSAIFTASAGGVLDVLGGARVTVPAGLLPTSTRVTLTVLDASPQQPRSTTAYRVSGPAAVLEFEGAQPSGQFQVQIPHAVVDGASTFAGFFVDDLFIPAVTTVDAANGRVTLTVDLKVLRAFNRGSGGARITIAAGEGIHILPPHVPWGSYNVYHFTNGAFQKIISLGTPVQQLPDLGDRPCVLVHGFGSSIHGGVFDQMAAFIVDNGLATGVIGFEYDTLDDVGTNGGYLNEALARFAGPRKWFIVAHSMGGLVSRTFLEQTSHSALDEFGSRLVTVCTPNLGSPVANAIEGSLDLFQEFVLYVVLNDIMDFTNADGKRCQVPHDAPGFIDLEIGNQFLDTLNANADEHHPEASYFAIGGDALSLEMLVLDVMVGVDTDDGLVTLPSAIDVSLCLADAAVLLVNHLSAVSSPLTFSQLETFRNEPIDPFCVQSIP